MEIDIFRSWRLLDIASFDAVRKSHWRKLPYWIFTPVGIAFAGSVVMIWWQAKLALDPLGAKSPLLGKILATHWIRTLLINAYALVQFFWVIGVVNNN